MQSRLGDVVKLRVILIGTGGMGRGHLRVWQELPQVQVVGLYDVVPAVARGVAEEFTVPKVYRSLREAVDEPDADAAVVCTPNMFHKEAVVAVLQSGKHCLCAKPLAVTADDIRAMIAARDQSRRLLMTAQHLRFEQRSQTLKRVVAAGRLGHVYYARAWWLRRRLAPTTPGFITRSQAGHGPGVDLGVHVLDLAMHLLDHPRPVSVTGVTGCHLGRRPDVANQWGPYPAEQFDVEDHAAGLVRFEGGLALSLEVSWLLNMPEPELYGVWLFGAEAGVRWPNLMIAHVQDGVLVDSQIVSDTGTAAYKNEMLAFVDAIIHDRPAPVPAEQSLAVARILEGLYASPQTGREVRLDNSPPS
jgi:predicted dehydrogenase